MPIQVFSFAKILDDSNRKIVYDDIKKGKSRFGMWDQKVSLHDQYHGGNGFLLKIKKDDWIVHVNSPSYGLCVAVKSVGSYMFDEGIRCSWGSDFCNFIPVDPESIVEFDRNNKNILPSVNLKPMRRGQRVLQVDDFLSSLENIRNNSISEEDSELRGVIHLRQKLDDHLLPKIANYIHELNRSKEFERFLHQIFSRMQNVTSIQNGFGWRTDHGADLIVEFQNPIAGISLSSKLIIQAKSYSGKHEDLNAIDQIVEGIEKYRANGGLLITTGESTEQLEDYALKKSSEISMPIDIIAGSDVARFVIRYAPDMLLGGVEV